MSYVFNFIYAYVKHKAALRKTGIISDINPVKCVML